MPGLVTSLHEPIFGLMSNKEIFQEFKFRYTKIVEPYSLFVLVVDDLKFEIKAARV